MPIVKPEQRKQHI